MRFEVLSSEELILTAAEAIVRVAQQPGATIALAGGTTFGPIYQCLAGRAGYGHFWKEVTFYFSDERCVPLTDRESNYYFASQHLGRIAQEARVIPMVSSGHPEEDARAYEKLLPNQIDLVLLGVGTDGHTASLFPGSKPDPQRQVVVTKAELPPQVPRITLTMPAINQAKEILVVATGSSKRGIIQALAQSKNHYPIQEVKPEARFLVDEAAGRGLATSAFEPR